MFSQLVHFSYINNLITCMRIWYLLMLCFTEAVISYYCTFWTFCLEISYWWTNYYILQDFLFRNSWIRRSTFYQKLLEMDTWNRWQILLNSTKCDKMIKEEDSMRLASFIGLCFRVPLKSVFITVGLLKTVCVIYSNWTEIFYKEY